MKQSISWLNLTLVLTLLFSPFSGIVHAAPSGAGDLDPNFGVGGWQTSNVQNGVDFARATALQSDGKIVAVGEIGGAVGLARYNPDGSLDSSFGTNGRQITILSGYDVDMRSVAIQPDGKIIVAGGYSTYADEQDFILYRYLADGTLDAAFGDNGILFGAFSSLPDCDLANGFDLVLQPDGKIIAAGYAYCDDITGMSYNFALARYFSGGSLDISFSSDGMLTVDFDYDDDKAFALALQTDGKIVAAGSSNSNFALIRCNPNGSLDTSFNSYGKVTTSFGVQAEAFDVLLQPDGKVIATGSLLGSSDFALARYSTYGTLDTSFDGDGKVTTDLSADEYLFSSALQLDGKIVVAGYGLISGTYDFVLVRYAPNGSLDPTLDDDGWLTTDFGGDDIIRGIVLQPDNKIVTVGLAEEYPLQADFGLARYLPNGSLDLEFDQDGKRADNFVGSIDTGSDIAVQTDGKIILGGSAQNGVGNTDFVLARYHSDGAPDLSFDGGGTGYGGIVTTDLEGYEDLTALTLQPDGKIVAAGGDGNGKLVARYMPDGSLDTSFSEDGWIKIYLPSFGLDSAFDLFSRPQQQSILDGANTAYDVTLQPDGKIVVIGYQYISSHYLDFAIARLTTDGNLDTSFDQDGLVTSDWFGEDDIAAAGLVQPDNRILVIGFTKPSYDDDFDLALARYNPDGSLDSSFGQAGLFTLDFFDGDDGGSGLALLPNGQILVVGSASHAGNRDVVLVRVNSNGSLDASFGNNGIVITDFANGDDWASDIALQGNGKILAAGTASTAYGEDFALARYHPDGGLDTSFSSDGKQTSDYAGGDDAGFGMALQPNGQIVVGGDVDNGGDSDLAVARYDSILALQFALNDLPLIFISEAYSQTIGALGGVAPYTYTLLDSTPPPGVSIYADAQGIQIDGMPTASGIYSFTAQVIDSNPGAPFVFQRTYLLETDARPQGAYGSVTMQEDQVFSFTSSDFTYSDPDGDPFGGIRIASPETAGDLECDGSDVTPLMLCSDVSQLVFRPDPNANGDPYASFGFWVIDERGGPSADVYQMTIAVQTVNDPPLLTPPGDWDIGEGDWLTFTLQASDVDLPLNVLSYTLHSAPPGAYLNPLSGAFFWMPSEAQGPGIYTLTAVVTDGELADQASFQVRVGEVNIQPVAAADIYLGLENQPLHIAAPGLLSNDSDPDLPGDALSALLVEAPAQGVLDLLPDGSFTYTPTLNFNGSLTFSYQVSDGQLSSASQPVTLVIEALNDPPHVVAGGDQDAQEGQPVHFSGSFLDPGRAPQAAEMTWDFGDGSLTASGLLTPTHVYSDQGVYTVTLTITDTHGTSASDSLHIRVSNAAPVLEPLLDLQAQVGEPVAVSGQFSDPGGLDTHWVLIQWTAHYTQALDLPAGELAFETAYLYASPGVYQVTVTLLDKDGAASQQTFSVTILALPAQGPHLYLPLIRR